MQKISSTVEDFLSVDQSGFCHGSSTCNQVTALTTFIENGFEKTLKTGAVFLDLIATYTSPLGTLASFYKLSKCMPLWCVQTVELLLRNRHFRVHVGDDVSSWGRQGPVWAREHCRISPPRFLAECRKRRLNQGTLVVLYFRLFTFSDLY